MVIVDAFSKFINAEGIGIVVLVGDDDVDDVEARTGFGMLHKNIIIAAVAAATFTDGVVVVIQDVFVSSIFLP